MLYVSYSAIRGVKQLVFAFRVTSLRKYHKNVGFRWIARKPIQSQIESARNMCMRVGAIRQVTVVEGYGGTHSLKKTILLDFD